jgi:hypothetical protein
LSVRDCPLYTGARVKTIWDALRRAAPFLRKIGIEISFGRKGRARTRTIHNATTPTHATPEDTGARPSASSAPSAPAPKSNPANGFAVPPPRTVTNDADGRADDSGKGGALTVRANPLKSNAETAADGATQITTPNPGRKKLVRAAGGRSCERGRGP